MNVNHQDEDSEATTSKSRSVPSVSFTSLDIMDSTKPPAYTRKNRFNLLLCTLLEIVIVFSLSTTSMPTARIVENTVCQRWYKSHPNDALHGGHGISSNGDVFAEEMCKANEIQSEVVGILGGWGIVETIVALLAMLPAGYLAKTMDRRIFLLLSITTGVISHVTIAIIGSNPLLFDPRLFWIAPLFDLVGGGFAFLGVVVRTIIAENVSKNQLSGVYYKLTAFTIFAKFAGNSLGSSLISIINPLTVLYIGTVLLVTLGAPLVLSLPRKISEKTFDIDIPIRYSDQSEMEENATIDPEPMLGIYDRLMQQIESKKDLFTLLRTLLSQYRSIRNSLVLLALISVCSGVRMSFKVWVSKRYGWTLSKTGIILSFETLLAGTVISMLPLMRARIFQASMAFKSLRLPPDLFVGATALFCAFISTSLLAIATTKFWFIVALVINSPSGALLDGFKSHCISMVGESEIMLVHLSFLYVQTLSSLVNGPLWINIFYYAYSEDNTTGLGLGLPFAICGGMLAGALMLVPLAKAR